jgi:hypothetical protein
MKVDFDGEVLQCSMNNLTVSAGRHKALSEFYANRSRFYFDLDVIG